MNEMTDEQKKKLEEYRKVRRKVRANGRSSLTPEEREIFDNGGI